VNRQQLFDTLQLHYEFLIYEQVDPIATVPTGRPCIRQASPLAVGTTVWRTITRAPNTARMQTQEDPVQDSDGPPRHKPITIWTIHQIHLRDLRVFVVK